MSQSGYTPIQLYRTSTAAAVPTAGNLAAGELAINLTDEALYFKNAAGVVTLLADSSGALGSVTSVAVSGGTTGLTTSGGPITSSGTITLAGTLNVANGGTGTATAFTTGSVVFAGASGVYSQNNANFFWDNTNARLGIGINTPAIKLQVSDVDQATARIGVRNANGQNYHLVAGLPGASNTGFAIFDATASATRIYLNSSGDVGIGTTSPTARLHVYNSGSGDATVRIGNVQNAATTDVGKQGATAYGANAAGDGFLYSSTSLSIMSDTGAGVIKFSTGGNAERMRIDSSGNVGIGATPSAWGASRVAIDMGSNSYVGGILQTNTTTNIYYDGSDWRYKANGPAALSQIYENFFAWTTVPTGTGGGVATLTEAMRLTGAGNLGIGTTTPVGKLTTVSTSGFTAPNLLCTDTVGTFRIVFQSSLYAAVPANKPWLHSYDDIYIGSDATTSFNVVSGGVNRLIVNSSGNVGIGTTSAVARLTAVGSATVIGQTNVSARFSDDTNSTLLISHPNTAGNPATITGNNQLAFATGTLGNIAERVRIDAGGNVGIGTTIPGAYGGRLTIGDPGNAFSNNVLLLTQYATATLVADGVTAANGAQLDVSWASGGQGPLRFTFSSTERMRLLSGGNLLIGATATTGYFDGLLNVAGYSCFKVSGSSITPVQIVWNNADSGDNEFISFFTNSGATFRGGINYNRAGGLVAYNVTSDYRAKDIIGPVTDVGETIDALKVYNGKMKGATIARPMLVAHEAQEVVPYAVTGEKDAVNEDGTDKYQQMDHQSLVPLLIAEIQSLRARVAQLEGN